MNHGFAQAGSFAEDLRAKLGDHPLAHVFVFPPATLISMLAKAFEGTSILVGAQNVHFENKGAFTGELSVGQVFDAGARAVLVGHSERRHVFGETDEIIAKKIGASLAGGLETVLCVGETLAEHESGSTADVVLSQLDAGLGEVAGTDLGRLWVAYEPVWAIGTGRTASPEQAQQVHAMIRKALTKRYGPKAGARVYILYGGSVKPGNVEGLGAQEDIDGCLVGGASLTADSFADIVFGAT
jgi:triosephosphate isomerase